MWKYFKNDNDNIFIAVVLLALLVTDVFVFFLSQLGWELIGIYLGALTFVPALVMLLWRSFASSLKKGARPTGSAKRPVHFALLSRTELEGDNQNGNIIQRTEHVEAVLNMIKNIRTDNYDPQGLNCIFLTGKSGAGKSVFLKKLLIPTLEEMGETVDFSREHKLSYAENATVIIVDQFEHIIQEELHEPLAKTKENILQRCLYAPLQSGTSTAKPLVFIFAFPEESMHNVFEYLISPTKLQKTLALNEKVYFLRANEQDNEGLLYYIAPFLNKRKGKLNTSDIARISQAIKTGSLDSSEHSNNTKVKLLLSVILSIYNNELPFVALFVLGSIIEIFDIKEALLDKCIDDVERIFYIYVDQWVGKFKNTDNAKALLYLLANMNKYELPDIECILFDTDVEFGSLDFYQDALSDLFFVETEEDPFTFKYYHSYIADKVLDYCQKSFATAVGKQKDIKHCKAIPPDLMANVDYYAKNSESDVAFNKNSQVLRKALGDRFETYKENQRNWRILFVITLAVVISINLYKYLTDYIKSPISFSDTAVRMFMSINCMLAAYYVYNYLKKVLCLYSPIWYLLPATVGAFALWVSYFNPAFWAIAIGVAVMALTLIHRYYIVTHTIERGKEEFLGLSKSLLTAAIGVFFLGTVYCLFSYLRTDDIWGLLVVDAVFSWYIVFNIWKHIDYEYLLVRIGFINRLVLKKNQM